MQTTALPDGKGRLLYMRNAMGDLEMNFTPSHTYEGLLRQANALRRLVDSLEARLEIQAAQLDTLTRQLAASDSAAIEAERDTNALLTEQVLQLESENEQLRAQLERTAVHRPVQTAH
jgi:chromosome segregation ATPase